MATLTSKLVVELLDRATGPSRAIASSIQRLTNASRANAARLFGPEHVTMLARTIVESDENEEALIEPIISAVSSVMTQRPYWPERGLDWIAAFDGIPLLDLLSTMRSLEIFSEQSLPRYLSMVLSIKLARALEPPAPVAPKRVRRRGRFKATARKGKDK